MPKYRKMNPAEVIEGLRRIMVELEENKDYYDWDAVSRHFQNFQKNIHKSLILAGELEALINKLKRKQIRTIRKIAKKLGIATRCTTKECLIYDISIHLIRNQEQIEQLRENQADKKEKPLADWKDLLGMNEDKMRKTLRSMKVKELRELARSILSTEQLRLKKAELIEAIVHRVLSIKAHIKMGPA